MRNLLYVLLMMLAISCSTEEMSKNEPVESQVRKISMNGLDVWVERQDSLWIHQGDIIVPQSKSPVKIYNKDQAPTKAAGVLKESTWPDGVIVYEVSSTLEGDSRIIGAMRHWEENTSISFKKRTNEDDYVLFIEGSGCYSYLGRTGGRQIISIHDYCSLGNTIHEIGHAAGLWHEQSRADRDQHMTIHWENIQEGREHNFYSYADKVSMEGQDLTEQADFGSIMMYSSYSFSSNGKPTITKKDGSTYSVQRNGLSDKDIEGIEKLYSEVPEYINGKYYLIYGITVLRYYDQWYYNMGYYGWKRVILEDGVWYFA